MKPENYFSPPTKNSIFQHTKMRLYVASFMWKRCLLNRLSLPSPSEWGWEWHLRLKMWTPYGTDLADASKGCTLLMNCGCVVAYQGNSKCSRIGIRCGPPCKCGGAFTNDED